VLGGGSLTVIRWRPAHACRRRPRRAPASSWT
jgi:hypothetical protein